MIHNIHPSSDITRICLKSFHCKKWKEGTFLVPIKSFAEGKTCFYAKWDVWKKKPKQQIFLRSMAFCYRERSVAFRFAVRRFTIQVVSHQVQACRYRSHFAWDVWWTFDPCRSTAEVFHVLPLQEVIVFAVVFTTVRCISKGYGIVVLASCLGWSLLGLLR